MKRAPLLLLLLPFAVGCSNRPLAYALDCLFPSKINRRPDPPPDGLFDPDERDRDRLPAPDLRDLRNRDDRRGGDLPRLNEPLRDDGQPLRRDAAPWVRESGDAMPLPNNGRY